MKKREAGRIERAMNARLDLATTADLLNELADRSRGIVVAFLTDDSPEAASFIDGPLPTCIGLLELVSRYLDAEIEQRMGA